MNSDLATAMKRKPRKRRVVTVVLLLVVLVLGAGIYLLRGNFTKPVEGKVVSSEMPDANTPQTEQEQFDGATFSLVHPMQYIEQPTKTAPLPNEIESHIFVSSGMVSKVLTTVVVKLPSRKLEDNQSFYMRSQDSGKYHMKSTAIKGDNVVLFSSNDGQQFQQSRYWAHGDKLLIISLTGQATDIPALTNECNDMVGSVTWR